MGLFVLWHQKGVCCLQEQSQDSLESEPEIEHPVTLQKCRTHLLLLSCYMLCNKPFVLLTQNKQLWLGNLLCTEWPKRNIPALE